MQCWWIYQDLLSSGNCCCPSAAQLCHCMLLTRFLCFLPSCPSSFGSNFVGKETGTGQVVTRTST